MENDWKAIETAPQNVASSPGDWGRRPVLVTLSPADGRAPIAIAELHSDGWRTQRGRRLWFKPTHWQPLPLTPDDSIGYYVIGDKRDEVFQGLD